ncbi:MAG: hypothetical protein R2705_24530 [Ilumatobacteraceae bacterium]
MPAIRGPPAAKPTSFQVIPASFSASVHAWAPSGRVVEPTEQVPADAHDGHAHD